MKTFFEQLILFTQNLKRKSTADSPRASATSSYDVSLFQNKADAVFAHIFDSYWDDGRSIYSPPA